MLGRFFRVALVMMPNCPQDRTRLIRLEVSRGFEPVWKVILKEDSRASETRCPVRTPIKKSFLHVRDSEDVSCYAGEGGISRPNVGVVFSFLGKIFFEAVSGNDGTVLQCTVEYHLPARFCKFLSSYVQTAIRLSAFSH
jgi:hypothetical protein